MSLSDNEQPTTCEICGGEAVEKTIADTWDDAPSSFTMRRTCRRGCPVGYAKVTPERMHELTGLPLTGWVPTTH